MLKSALLRSSMLRSQILIPAKDRGASELADDLSMEYVEISFVDPLV